MRLIYVAGPYSGKTKGEIAIHIERGMRICLELIYLGYAVHCPWLDQGYGSVCPIPGLSEVDVNAPDMVKMLQKNSLAILERLDPSRDGILLIPGYQGSEGANRELYLAKKRGLPVFYDQATMLRVYPPKDKR